MERLRGENIFLKQINEQMLRDAVEKGRNAFASKESEKVKQLEKELEELSVTNRDLMFFIESKDAIQHSKGSELDARFGKIEIEQDREDVARAGRKITAQERLKQKLKERQQQKRKQ